MDSLRGQPNPESRVRAEHIDRSIERLVNLCKIEWHLHMEKARCIPTEMLCFGGTSKVYEKPFLRSMAERFQLLLFRL